MKGPNSTEFKKFIENVREMRRLQISYEMHQSGQTDTWKKSIEQKVDNFIKGLAEPKLF